MTDMISQKVFCPQCGSEMRPDHDLVNRVRVFVCTKPTCLYRVYPDYPRRTGNQEICCNCSTLFTVIHDSPGVLCPQCREAVQKNKRNPQGRPRASAKNVRVIRRQLTA